MHRILICNIAVMRLQRSESPPSLATHTSLATVKNGVGPHHGKSQKQGQTLFHCALLGAMGNAQYVHFDSLLQKNGLCWIIMLGGNI